MELIPAELPQHLFTACSSTRLCIFEQWIEKALDSITGTQCTYMYRYRDIDSYRVTVLWMLSHRIKPEAGNGPTTNQICLTAVRSRTPGWSGISLTHSLLVCLYFPPLLFITPSLFHALMLLSLHPLLSCSPCLLFSHSFVKHAYPTSKLHHNNPDKSHKQFSAVLFIFCLSSTSNLLTLSLFQSQLFSL